MPAGVVSLQNGVGNEGHRCPLRRCAHRVAGTLATTSPCRGGRQIRIDKPRFTMGLSRWSPAVDARRSRTCTMHWPAPARVTCRRRPRHEVDQAAHEHDRQHFTSAILDLAPDQIFADKHLANLEIDAWREALAVMRARDIPALNVGSFPFATLAAHPLRAQAHVAHGVATAGGRHGAASRS
ncbi:MAG: hypothetical protein R2838_19560 [Caldilineaceae bacterium]